MINIALPKGRLGEKVYSMFEKAGFDCPAIKETNRKLIFENFENGVRYFWVKPSDVAIYVEHGVADIGVAGKDILLEYEPDVYELLDLDIGKCRMAVAAKKDFSDNTERTLRVATKFSNIAQLHQSKDARNERRACRRTQRPYLYGRRGLVRLRRCNVRCRKAR